MPVVCVVIVLKATYRILDSIVDVVVKSHCTCSRLQGEISDTKSRWESDVAERSRENVARDVELNTLHDADAKLRAELTQRKHDIDRFVVFFGTCGH